MSSTTEVRTFSDIKPLAVSKSTARWLAGVIDCEGFICATRGAGLSVSCYVGLGMTTRKFVEAVKNATGLGRKIRKVIVKNPHARPQYHWVITKHAEVRRLLVTIFPYLILKQKQAALVLQFPALHVKTRRAWKQRAYVKLKAMNSRGR